MDDLPGVVVVVPDAGRPVRVGARDVTVKAVAGGIVQDVPEVRRGVKHLGAGVGVAGLEGREVADQLRVEGVEVGDEGVQVGLLVEGGGFVKGYRAG